jgi:YD repeat-containing protein
VGVESEAAQNDTALGASRMLKRIILLLTLLAVSDAHSQQQTIYGPDGKVTGRVTTDSQGSTTIYDAAGRVTGRTSTDSQGTTTIYDAAGRRTGTVTNSRGK